MREQFLAFPVMLGYNTPDMIEGGMVNFAKTVDPDFPIKKVFVELGYPKTDAAGRDRNRANSEKYGWEYHEFENAGVLPNWNKVIHEILIPIYGMQNGDFLHTFDPDVRMNSPGWLPSMVAALQADPKTMFCCSSMYFHSHEWMYKPPYNRKVKLENNVNVARWDCLIAWPSGMWKADFMITRPRDFACAGAFYGWNEHADYERLLAHGFRWCSVADFIDHHMGSGDQDYIDWKRESAEHKTKVSYADWLKSKGKI